MNDDDQMKHEREMYILQRQITENKKQQAERTREAVIKVMDWIVAFAWLGVALMIIVLLILQSW